MDTYPKMFSSTKNIPDTEGKQQKQHQQQHNYQQHSADKPFSEPYYPKEDFDYMSLLQPQQKYYFNLNHKYIFPREELTPFNDFCLPPENEEVLPQRQDCPLKLSQLPHFELPEPNLPNWEDMQIEDSSQEGTRDENYF